MSEQVRSRCFCAHFLHSNRAAALLMPKIRLPQAAEGLLIPSCLFGPGRAETNRPSFLSLRPFCLFALPSQQQHQISSNCRQRQSESRGSSGDRSGSRKKERQQQGQQQQGQQQQGEQQQGQQQQGQRQQRPQQQRQQRQQQQRQQKQRQRQQQRPQRTSSQQPQDTGAAAAEQQPDQLAASTAAADGIQGPPPGGVAR